MRCMHVLRLVGFLVLLYSLEKYANKYSSTYGNFSQITQRAVKHSPRLYNMQATSDRECNMHEFIVVSIHKRVKWRVKTLGTIILCVLCTNGYLQGKKRDVGFWM